MNREVVAQKSAGFEVLILKIVSGMVTDHQFLFGFCFDAVIVVGESPQILSRSSAHGLLTPSVCHVSCIVWPLMHHAAWDLQCSITYYLLHPQLTRKSETEEVGFKAVRGWQLCVVWDALSANYHINKRPKHEAFNSSLNPAFNLPSLSGLFVTDFSCLKNSLSYTGK